MDTRTINSLTRLHLAMRYMSDPCPYCGHEWQSVDELISEHVVYSLKNGGVAAHPTCYYKHEATQEWRDLHPEFAEKEEQS